MHNLTKTPFKVVAPLYLAGEEQLSSLITVPLTEVIAGIDIGGIFLMSVLRL